MKQTHAVMEDQEKQHYKGLEVAAEKLLKE